MRIARPNEVSVTGIATNQTNTQHSTWKTSLLRVDWRQVLNIHLAYTLLGVILFAPLVALVGRLLLSLSRQPVLADQDIAWFLLSPAGIAALVCLLGLLITILGFELASLMVMAAGSAQGLSIGSLAALRYTTARAHKILSFAVRLVVRGLLLSLPFLAVGGAIAGFLLTEHDINYYLSDRPMEFWTAAVLIALLALAMLIILVTKLLAWSMALPLLLFGNVAPKRSFAESERFTLGSRRELIEVIVIWSLLAVILGGTLMTVIQLLGSLVVPNFFGSMKMLVPVVGGFVALWVLGNFVVTVLAAGSLAYVLIAFYEQLSPSEMSADLHAIAHEQPTRSWRHPALVLPVVLAAAAVIAIMVGHWLLNGIRISDTVTIVAHRGAAGKAPENTLASVRHAIADGTDWVEIDVQESADGEVIVVHDSDFMKLAGVDLKVRDATLEQIREIDVGSWFDPKFASERVPTLLEVLEEARGKSSVVIELKYYGHDQQLERRVVDIVELASMTDAVAIMSLDYAGVQKIRTLRPGWTVGLLAATAIGKLENLDVDFLAVARGTATPAFVRRSHEQGKQVFVWTINDAVTMSRMMSLGVDGIITDEPALARDVMSARADLNPAERLLMHTAILFGKPEPQRLYRDDSP